MEPKEFLSVNTLGEFCMPIEGLIGGYHVAISTIFESTGDSATNTEGENDHE